MCVCPHTSVEPRLTNVLLWSTVLRCDGSGQNNIRESAYHIHGCALRLVLRKAAYSNMPLTTQVSYTASRHVGSLRLNQMASNRVCLFQDDLCIAIQLAMIGAQKLLARATQTTLTRGTHVLSLSCAVAAFKTQNTGIFGLMTVKTTLTLLCQATRH